jgi:hypothetical protein
MTHWRPVAVGAVWALLFAMAGVIVVTYSRLSPEQLYNVSEDGLAGGLGRALVFLNYPVSLVAIAIAWLAAEQIGSSYARLAALVASGLCVVTAIPGVVDQHDLDAKPVNALPAVGVVIALALSLRARWERPRRLPLDRLRIAVAAVAAVASIPWIFAVLGFHAPGDVFLGEEIRRGGDGRLGPAVHLGDHEGLDGVLLIVSALVLSRLRAPFALALYVALMFAYGFGVALKDFWLEQLQKRDWVSWGPPNVLRPDLSLGWLLVVLLALGVAVALRRLEAPRRRA